MIFFWYQNDIGKVLNVMAESEDFYFLSNGQVLLITDCVVLEFVKRETLREWALRMPKCDPSIELELNDFMVWASERPEIDQGWRMMLAHNLYSMGKKPAPKEWEYLIETRMAKPVNCKQEPKLMQIIGFDICVWCIKVDSSYKPMSDFYFITSKKEV